MSIVLNAQEKAGLDRLESQIETSFLEGTQYPSGTTVVPKVEGYKTSYVIKGINRAGEFNPKIKAPFKNLFAAMMRALEGWTDISSFQNGWVNFDASQFNACGYYQNFFRRVYLKGLVKSGTISYGAAGQIFQLPVGYRPSRMCIFAVASNDAFGQVRIGSDGWVYATPPSSPLWVCLDGISFRAEQ